MGYLIQQVPFRPVISVTFLLLTGKSCSEQSYIHWWFACKFHGWSDGQWICEWSESSSDDGVQPHQSFHFGAGYQQTGHVCNTQRPNAAT